MSKNTVFATKLPVSLKKQIDKVCARLGVRKNFLVEEAIREKLENLLDAYDLRESISEATEFRSWKSVKKELKLSRSRSKHK